MAKKRSLFDDSHDCEIQELTGIIRHDLSSLTKQLGDLRTRSIAASQGGNSAHLQKHSSNLVGTLQAKVAVITQKFKDVLEVRTEVSENMFLLLNYSPNFLVIYLLGKMIIGSET